MNLNKTKKLAVLIMGILLIGTSYIYYPKYKDYLKWQEYFNRTELGEPNILISQYFEHNQEKSPLTVLDLGAGNGSDTKYFVDKKHVVYSVDFHEESIRRIDNSISLENKQSLHLIKSRFEDLDWNSMPEFDVVIAINSIFFITRKEFDLVWKNIKNRTKKDGLVILRLFGNKIDWPNMKGMTLLSKEEISSMIKGFEIIKFSEDFYKEKNITQHAYNLILKKLD